LVFVRASVLDLRVRSTIECRLISSPSQDRDADRRRLDLVHLRGQAPGLALTRIRELLGC